MYEAALAAAREKVQRWTSAAEAARAAIDELARSGAESTQTKEATEEAAAAGEAAEETEAKPTPTTEDVEELTRRKQLIREHYTALARRGVITWGQAAAAISAALASLEGGFTTAEATSAGDEAADKAGEEDPAVGLGRILGGFGDVGELTGDVDLAGKIAKPIQGLLRQIGLTPEALEALMTSPMDRDLAAQVASGAAQAAQIGLGLVYSVGVLAEVASLGQVDTLVDMIDDILRNMGFDEILKPLFTAPYYAALTVPVRQYWLSRFKPTVPGIGDLRTMAVREAFPVETREEQFAEMARWGAYHGLDEYWMDRYLLSGYVRMDVRTAIDQVYWRRWKAEQLSRFLSIADIHPEDHEAIMATMWRNPTRYERRHGFIMGVYDRAALVEYFHRDGLSDEDAEHAAEAMIAYALNTERNAVARAAGRIYRETLEAVASRHGAGDITGKVAAGLQKRAEAELRKALEDLKIVGERQSLWVQRYRLEAQATIKPWEEWEELAVVTEEGAE